MKRLYIRAKTYDVNSIVAKYYGNIQMAVVGDCFVG